LLLLCAAGLGTLVVGVPLLRWGILGTGLGYLLWLAWRLARTRTLAEADQARLDVGFWQGVGLQFVNIKAWMLALAIVAGWIAGRPDAASRTLQVLPLMAAFAFFSNLTYALVGALLRDWLAGPVANGLPTRQRLVWFNRTMAAVLALTAAWMLASALAPAMPTGTTP
jgi:threonine/homoserine/homoserine lactone efflux protein